MRPAEQIRYLILAAQREGNRQIATAMSQFGLTPAQSEALRIVADHGPLSLKDIGDMLVCDSGTSPSRIVGRLVAAGLVQRDVGEHDRRRVRLTATDDGRTLSARILARENQLYDFIDHAIDADEAATLLRVLHTITHGSPAGSALENRRAAERLLHTHRDNGAQDRQGEQP